GNVAALDVLRAMGRSPESVEAFLGELNAAVGVDDHYDTAVKHLERSLSDLEDLQYRARAVVEEMALTLQASVLMRFAPRPVAEAFTVSCLGGGAGGVFGTRARGVETEVILDPARPRHCVVWARGGNLLVPEPGPA